MDKKRNSFVPPSLGDELINFFTPVALSPAVELPGEQKDQNGVTLTPRHPRYVNTSQAMPHNAPTLAEVEAQKRKLGKRNVAMIAISGHEPGTTPEHSPTRFLRRRETLYKKLSKDYGETGVIQERTPIVNTAQVKNRMMKPGKSQWVNDNKNESLYDENFDQSASALGTTPPPRAVSPQPQMTHQKSHEISLVEPPTISPTSSVPSMPPPTYHTQPSFDLTNESRSQKELFGFDEYIGEAEKELLQALVQGKAYHGSPHKEVVRIVILIHPTFVSSFSLLRFLIHTQYQAGLAKDKDTDDRVHLILQSWMLKSSHEDFSDMEERILLCNWRLTRELPVDLVRSIKEQNIQDPMPLPLELREANTRQVAKKVITSLKKHVHLDYIAVQLTYHDFALFKRLKRKDLLRFVEIVDDLEEDDSDNEFFQDVRDDFNKTVQWYATLVVTEGVETLKKIIHLGEYFLMLNNLNGLLKIYTALTLPFTTSILVGAWKDLKKEQTVWEQIENRVRELMDDTFKNFNQIVQRGTPVTVIPCFYLLLQRVELIQKKRVTSNNPFFEMQVLSSLIESVFQNRIPYNITQDSGFKLDDTIIMEHSVLQKTARESKELRKTLKRTDVVHNRLVIHSWHHYSTYSTRIECWYCKKYIWGIRKETFQCLVCGYIAHEGCHDQADRSSPCKEELLELINKHNQQSTKTDTFFSNNRCAYKTDEVISQEEQVSANELLKQLVNGQITKTKFSTDFRKLIDTAMPLTVYLERSNIEKKQTLFHVMAYINNVAFLDYMMRDWRKKPNIDSQDSQGWTALHIACNELHFAMIEFLIDHKASVNVPNSDGSTPIFYLARKKTDKKELYLKCMNMLIQKGAEINVQNKNGETPLHQACRYGNSVGVEFLLQCPGIDINQLNNNKEDPFTIALATSQRQIITSFQKEGSRRLETPSPHKNHPRIMILSSADDHWVIEQSVSGVYDYQQECENLTVELESDMFYKKYFSQEHVNIFCFDDDNLGVISLAQEETNYRLLIRTVKGDHNIQLPEVTHPTKILNTLEYFSLSGELVPMEAQEEFAKVMVTTERNMQLTEAPFDLLYVRDKQYGLISMMKNDYKTHSPEFNGFLDFLGEKNLKEGTVRTRVKNKMSLHFFVSSLMSLKDKKEFFGQCGVIVVFLESTSFSLSLLSSFLSNVAIFIQPCEENGVPGYRLATCYKNKVHKFGPMISSHFVYPRDNNFKSFLLSKLMNASRNARTPSLNHYIREIREEELGNLWEHMSHLNNLREGGSIFSSKSMGINQFTIGEILGSGGMSTAHKATYKSSGEVYCIKEVPKKGQEPSQLEQLKGETALMKRLNHPNILKAYDMFETSDHLYFILELCLGGSIQQDVDRNGVYNEAKTVQVMNQVLSAVNHMHKKFVSHRDLKPENILYFDKEKKTVKIIDFGFGKEFSESGMIHTHLGTWNYMAPEMRDAEESYDYEKVDIWAVGCIMHFMLFGKPPFHRAPFLLDQYIESGKFPFENTSINISDNAKDLMTQLLKPAINERVTAAAALRHKWLSIVVRE